MPRSHAWPGGRCPPQEQRSPEQAQDGPARLRGCGWAEVLEQAFLFEPFQYCPDPLLSTARFTTNGKQAMLSKKGKSPTRGVSGRGSAACWPWAMMLLLLGPVPRRANHTHGAPGRQRWAGAGLPGAATHRTEVPGALRGLFAACGQGVASLSVGGFLLIIFEIIIG